MNTTRMYAKKGVEAAKWMFLLLIVLTFIPVSGAGQAKKSLSQMLWERAKKCYSNFVDENGDGKPDGNVIDDSKNGYLQISGSWPECGCSCTSTVGAYVNSAGEYIFLQSDSYKCSWEKKISSNKNLNDLMPKDFGIHTFISQPVQGKINYPVFFLNFEIPRYGTDTKVTIELVPFGLRPDGNGLLCFEYREKEGAKNCTSLYRIADIARSMKDPATLDHIMKGNFNKISAKDKNAVMDAIGNDESRFKSQNDLQKALNELWNIYTLYQSLESTEVVLGWSKQDGRFSIKSKKGKPAKMSFKDFLINNRFWSPMC
ncbi:MAG: hypothetical protein AB1444_10565 [Spirochaetota bacterium]